MNRNRLAAGAALILAIAALPVAIASCGGKSHGPTAPPPGGGGTETFSSGTLGAAATYDHVFTVAGTHDYRCTFHSASNGSGGFTGMIGTVTVDTAASAPTTVNVDIGQGGSMTFNPQAATVKLGGTVHWTNQTGTHDVQNY
jgi:plastocyanin